MPTQLQTKIAQLLIEGQNKKEKLLNEAEEALHDGRAAISVLELVKTAKRDLTLAITRVGRIGDPELKELVKQRMLEIWQAPEVEED